MLLGKVAAKRLNSLNIRLTCQTVFLWKRWIRHFRWVSITTTSSAVP